MKKQDIPIAQILRTQRNYFRDQMDEIHMRNLQLMRTISWVGIMLFSVYYILTVALFRSFSISLWYGVCVPCLIAFLVYIRKALQDADIRMKSAKTATLLFYFMLIAYIIIMSVFPHPDLPSVYYPLFLVMAPVVFILPIAWHLVFSFVSLAVFYVLVLRFKMPAIWSHELFEATTALVFAQIVNILMTQFRVQSDSLKDKYFHLSQVDRLTGIMNKEAGKEVCEEYLRARQKGNACAALFVDLDNFKKINDEYGHNKGDIVLAEVGNALRLICRKDDIVFRFGGDEFFILLKDIENKEHVEMKADHILAYMQVIGKQQGLELGCSIGICHARGENLDFQTLTQKADSALYQAKTAGRNCCKIESFICG